MTSKQMKGSELIVSDDGTVYHLQLKKRDIPKNIILVGDPERAYQIAKHFDSEILFEKKNREFITLVGKINLMELNPGVYQKMPVAVIGTGIGPDNTEIVAAELHALNEYCNKNKIWKEKYKPLNIIRVGTSGSPQKNIPVGSLGVGKYAIGLDNLGLYYPYKSKDKTLNKILSSLKKTEISKVNPYVSKSTPKVLEAIVKACESIGLKNGEGKGYYIGITTSAPGFYAPQGRKIGRLDDILIPNLQEILSTIDVDGLKAVNNEMESSAIFRILGEKLGYNVGAVCAVIANRNTGEFIAPEEYINSVDRAIQVGLNALKIFKLQECTCIVCKAELEKLLKK